MSANFSTTVAQSFTSLSSPPFGTDANLIAGSKADSTSGDLNSQNGATTRTFKHHSTHFTYHTWVPSPPTASAASPLSYGSSQTPPHPLSRLAVAGIVVGTLAAFTVMLIILRCWWHWKKTPQRNRIEALLHRYQLDREMGEAAVEPIRARVPRPPPPPYRPPPPGYNDTLLSESTAPPIAQRSSFHLPTREVRPGFG